MLYTIMSILYIITIAISTILIVIATFKYNAITFDDFMWDIWDSFGFSLLLFVPLYNVYIMGLMFKQAKMEHKIKFPFNYEKKFKQLFKMLIKQNILNEKQISSLIDSAEMIEKLLEE